MTKSKRVVKRRQSRRTSKKRLIHSKNKRQSRKRSQNSRKLSQRSKKVSRRSNRMDGKLTRKEQNTTTKWFNRYASHPAQHMGIYKSYQFKDGGRGLKKAVKDSGGTWNNESTSNYFSFRVPSDAAPFRNYVLSQRTPYNNEPW